MNNLIGIKAGRVSFFIFVIFTFTSITIQAQNNWLNFTNSSNVRDVVFQGEYIWAATSGGLLKISSVTNEKVLFNRANSGIPSNNISCLLIDSSNMLWVGTYDEGIAKYNGETWERFENFNRSSEHNRIINILQDSDGIIWIGTERGLYRFYEGSFHNDLNAGVIIQALAEDKNGAVWIGRSGGITKFFNCRLQYFGQGYKPYPFFDVRDFAVSRDNKIWIAAKEGLISYLNGNFDKLDINNVDLPNGIITSIAIDSENNLWIGSPYGRIARYNGYNFELFNAKNSELSGARINKLKTDDSGTIWVCTEKGLYKYNSGWDLIPTSTTLLNIGQNTKIFSDNNLNIWLCDGGDLYMYTKNDIKHYGKGNSKFQGAYTIVNDKNGKIWIGHSKGLTSFDGNVWKKYDTLQTILFNREKEILNLNNDTAWAKNNYKYYLIDSSSLFEPGYYVTKLHFDHSGNLWIRASEYLVKFDMTNWTVFDKFDSGMPTNEITCITSDIRNHLWLGTSKHGLYEYNGDDFISCLSEGTFPDTNIVSLHNFNDTLVISTDKQIQFLPDCDLREQNKMMFISPYVRDIFKDSKGNYWFGSRYGLFEFTSPEKRAMYDSYNSGLASNYVSSITEDYAGNLWILTSTGGVNIFNENTIVDEERIKDFFLYGKTPDPDITH